MSQIVSCYQVTKLNTIDKNRNTAVIAENASEQRDNETSHLVAVAGIFQNHIEI